MLTCITIIANVDFLFDIIHGSEAEVWQQYGAHIAVVFSFIKLSKTSFLNADTQYSTS